MTDHEKLSSLLKKIYYDPETGLQGADELYRRAKENEALLHLDPTIKKKDVQAWLKRQETNQVHALPARIKHYWPIKSNEKNHIWQCDLLDVSATAHTNGANFLLCVEDIWTRYAWVVPLKNKEGKTSAAAFQQVLDESGRTPKVLMSDNGSEFKNRWFRALLKENGIQTSYAEPGDHHRMGIIERFNKTIRGKLVTYMTAYKTKKYIDVLPKLVANYNTSKHSAIGITPKFAAEHPDDPRITRRLALREFLANQEQIVFEVGDKVRSLKNKVMFEKGAMPKFSQTVHEILGRIGNKRYELDNGKTYLYYQLKPAGGVDSFEPPEPSEPNEASEAPLHSEPKKQRLALKKEGIEIKNLREGLRERKPAIHLMTKHGERVNW
jgi:transposase InsO family protein